MSAQLQPNLQLRPMQMHDLDNVMQIEPTIYSHPWTLGNFSDSLSNGYSAWVLEDISLGKTSEMIGYSLLMIVMDEAHLLNLSVIKHMQKQGLGRYLLEHMCKIAKNYKALNMFLEVRPSNISAIALYENMGFCEIAVRRGYYPADPKISETGREDAILMGLAL
jgi:[ribosomal protein S18]-alanine N-acetyltransferase